MTPEELSAHLNSIEQRLGALERSVFGTLPAASRPTAPSPRPPATAAAGAPAPKAAPVAASAVARSAAPTASTAPPVAPRAIPSPRAQGRGGPTATASSAAAGEDLTITHVLGWAGAIALVLAAAYLIRLAIDAGWLTPPVQVSAAALFGLVLIGLGLQLRRSQPQYAALLPAAGIVVLFLTVYGAHLLYGLLSVRAADVAVLIVSATSLGLCFAFDTDLYALFAVAGSYSAPFLIPDAAGSFGDVAVYYSAWSVTFTLFALVRGRRAVYLLALYVALIGFDALARAHAIDWHVQLAFQSAQFLIFGIGAVAVSIRRGEPMSSAEALQHLPALLIFYALEYFLLKAHVPHTAPWVAVGVLVIMALLYLVVRRVLGHASRGGELLLGCYAALVLLHAGYLESVPAALGPWVVIVLAVSAPLLVRAVGLENPGIYPLLVVVGLLFFANLLRIDLEPSVTTVPQQHLLGWIYAALLYTGYGLTRDEPRVGHYRAVMLYAGHLTAMAATVRLIHVPIVQSVTWALLALGCLGVSVRLRDRLIGQSSLLLFAATAIKVMLYDLAGAAPLVRIVSLLILGATFYVGGLLYQRIARESA